MSKCLTCERVQRESRERESREREVIIGLDLAAAAGVDKACAIRKVSGKYLMFWLS